jgi:hypothetical protein
MTSLFAAPPTGGDVVLICRRPSRTPRISERLPRASTRTLTNTSSTGGTPVAREALPGQTGTGLIDCRKITAACNSKMAKIGEMSRPPTLGMMRRKGLRTGSESVVRSAVIGL